MTENGDHFDITTQVTCLSCIINMSGENIETEATNFCKLEKNKFFMLEHVCYVAMNVNAMEQQTSSIRKSYLRTNIFFKKV